MSVLKRILGTIYAEEDNTEVKLRGVRTIQLMHDIMKTWSTSKIEQNMFSSMGRSLISFPLFFAPDVHFILMQLLAHRRRSFLSVKDLHKAVQELEEHTWLKRLKEEYPTKLDKSKLSLFHKTPLPPQARFFDTYDQNTQAYGLNGYLLSAAAGTGKTLTCLMLAEMLHARIVIMVVPKNAVYKVWSKALNGAEYKKPQPHWIAADGKPYKGERFLIAHYEALDKLMDIIHQVGTSNVFVILDESHNLNEITAVRTNLFVQACQTVHAQNVIWSSGTPIKALGQEAIPILRTIDPLFTPDVESRFLRIFGKTAQRALNILRNRMGLITFKVDKAEVVDNKATERTVRVKIPNGEDYTLENIKGEMQRFVAARMQHYEQNMKSYEKIYDDALAVHEKTLTTSAQKHDFKVYQSYIKAIRKNYDPILHKEETQYCNEYEIKNIAPSLPRELRDEFKGARSVIKYVHLKVMGEALGGVLGKKRAQCHVDMVKYAELEKYVAAAEKKTVIFTSYVEALKAIDSHFQKLDYKPVVIYGETNNNLTGLVTQFEEQPEANPAIATYKSLSTAVPLIVANTAVFFNSPYREYEMTQAKARVDRLGQDTPVRFIHIVLDTGDRPNISTRSSDILEWSQNQIRLIMGSDYSGGAAKALDDYFIGAESYALEEYFVSTENPFEVNFESLRDEIFDNVPVDQRK